MANEPTDADIAAAEVTTGTIRQAILDRIPDETHIIRDVQINAGMARISLRWRMLVFATSMAIQDQTPEQIADSIEAQFKEWVAKTVANMRDTNRYSQPIEEMANWLKAAA